MLFLKVEKKTNSFAQKQVTAPAFFKFLEVTISYFSPPHKILDFSINISPQKDKLKVVMLSRSDVSSTQQTDASNLCLISDYQHVNGIAAEVRNMIFEWEKANAAAKSGQENVPSSTRVQVSPCVFGPDLQQPPQRYRRVSKRAHVG